MIVSMTGVIGFNTPLNPLSRGERDTPCLYKLALSGKSGLPDLQGIAACAGRSVLPVTLFPVGRYRHRRCLHGRWRLPSAVLSAMICCCRTVW